MTEFSRDNEAFGCWAIMKARDDRSVVWTGNFIADAVGMVALDAFKSISENVRFNMVLVLHDDHAIKKCARKLTNSMCPIS